MSAERSVQQGLEWLALRGLNLAALLSMERLSTDVPRLAAEADQFPTLLLIGSTGGAMWDSIGRLGYGVRPDPVDEHAADSVAAFCDDYLDEIDHRVMWPTPLPAAPLPLTVLGRAAGWAWRSPMGLGVHPVHGLWTAYRGVVLLGVALPERREPADAHPCESCPDQPCVSACPGGATGGPAGLDIEACFTQRTRPAVPCNHLCQARGACPIGGASRYPDAQARHHFAAAGRSLALYLDRPGPPPRPPPEWAS